MEDLLENKKIHVRDLQHCLEIQEAIAWTVDKKVPKMEKKGVEAMAKPSRWPLPWALTSANR